ncbi:ABC transporter ATP-binding protein [Xanthomonas sp. WHRI 1810A]|uniref:ABC transporter ATP-binding protein n=1 Tax=Xanthomonas sp. WHRI 1810A TaxID=3161565 RepID=UPI0032E8EC77
MLHLRAVHKTHGQGSQRFSLEIPHLALDAGQQIALVGPSGCGKSTVLDLLAMVLSPDQCQQFEFSTTQLVVDIAQLWRKDRQNRLAEIRAREMGYVVQAGGLLGYLDVRSNIALSRRLLGLSDDGSVERLAQHLGIADQMDKRPHQLSIGQRQRVSCARALAHTPRLLLADEPTAALDPPNARRVMGLLLSRAREQGVCCVVATHDERLIEDSGLSMLRIASQRDADGGVTATLQATQ